MKTSRLFIPALALLCIAITAQANGTLQVAGAWIREAPPGAQVLAGYLTLTNTADTPLTLEAVSSPDFAAVEIHRSLVEDGIARMQPVDGLTVPANGSIRLAPGAYHLMLFRPAQAFRAGDSVTLLLHQADGPCIRVSAPLRRQTGEAAHQH